MNDEFDALLRDHYRAAADGVHADPDMIRRFQDAGRPARPAGSMLRRWALPALAAAVTAAVLVAMAVFLWPGARDPEPPRPLTPPTAPTAPLPSAPLPAQPGQTQPGPAQPVPQPSTT